MYTWDVEIKKQKKEKYLKDLLENQDLPDLQRQPKKAAAKSAQKKKVDLRSQPLNFPGGLFTNGIL